MNTGTLPIDIENVTDGGRAAVLVGHPIRRQLLAKAAQPISATQLASELGLTRQRVNYHVRQLAKAGYLRPAGRRMRRNLVEQRYVATARSYVLSPQMLGPVSAASVQPQDAFSASYLLGLTALAQQEVGAVLEASQKAEVRIATLSLNAAVRFADPAQRAAFTEALTSAIAELIAKHTTPDVDETGAPGAGRRYRLMLGCYPILKASEATHE